VSELARTKDMTCVRCGVTDDPDLRTLWMACFYAMEELAIPFEDTKLGERRFYTLRVCKGCRASWLAAIEAWFSEKPETEDDDPEADIPIRERGVTHMITREEWERRRSR
jgi:hypothetical protein